MDPVVSPHADAHLAPFLGEPRRERTVQARPERHRSTLAARRAEGRGLRGGNARGERHRARKADCVREGPHAFRARGGADCAGRNGRDRPAGRRSFREPSVAQTVLLARKCHWHFRLVRNSLCEGPRKLRYIPKTRRQTLARRRGAHRNRARSRLAHGRLAQPASPRRASQAHLGGRLGMAQPRGLPAAQQPQAEKLARLLRLRRHDAALLPRPASGDHLQRA